MTTKSAGILMYRCGDAGLDALLVHPDGPFWRNLDLGAWSVPKGELEAGTMYVPASDRAAWFAIPPACEKILAGQRPFLDRLEMPRNS